MYNILFTKLCIVFLFCSFTQVDVSAQNRSIYRNTSNGNMLGYPATIDVICNCFHQNPNDQSYDTQNCRGQIRVGNLIYRLNYEGYIALAPYDAVLVMPGDRANVRILMSGGKYKIISGGASLGPPETWGEFPSNWVRVQ